MLSDARKSLFWRRAAAALAVSSFSRVFMQLSCILSLYGVLVFSSPAMAMNEFWVETLVSSTSTATTYLTSRDKKRIAATQDDASSFVASDGAIRGAYLEAAINTFRTAHPEIDVSDMALAQALLAR